MDTVMTDKTKRKFQNNIVYIILGLLILSMICIAIAVSLGSAKEPTPTPPADSTPTPSESTPPAENPNPNPDTDTDTQPTLSFVIPLDGTVAKLHDEDRLVMSPTMNDYRVHIGLDIQANVGTAIKACADGTVKHIYEDPFMGTSIVIDHGDGLTSLYQNLAETPAQGIAEGVSVKAGDIIGAVGETAIVEIAEEPHLHFEMKNGDEAIDPMDYVPYSSDIKTDASYEDE